MNHSDWIPAGLAIALIALLTAIGIYDVCCAYGIIEGPSVSSLIHRWALAFPVLPLLIGVLLGHLFWPVR